MVRTCDVAAFFGTTEYALEGLKTLVKLRCLPVIGIIRHNMNRWIRSIWR